MNDAGGRMNKRRVYSSLSLHPSSLRHGVVMMNEDYLWDKTGEDPEIEKLENALAAFRYKKTAPPELPAKILPFKRRETPRRFIRYAYAAAACVAFAVISLAVWLQISNKKTGEASAEITAIYAPQNNFESPTDTFAPLVQKSGTAKETAKPQVVKIKKVVPRNKIILARAVKKDKSDELTSEEKYAYNQLMLALSITGSKLRLVSDKIDTGKENAVNRDGK